MKRLKYDQLLRYKFKAKPNQDLDSHSQVVLDLFKTIFDTKVIERFIDINFEKLENITRSEIKELFSSFLCDLAYYHDFGKAFFGFEKERLSISLGEEEKQKLYAIELEAGIRFNIHPINSYFYLLQIDFFKHYFSCVNSLGIDKDNKNKFKTILSALSLIIIYHHFALEDIHSQDNKKLKTILFNGFDDKSLKNYLVQFSKVAATYLSINNEDKNILQSLDNILQDIFYLTEIKSFLEFFKYCYSCLIYSDEYASIYGNMIEEFKPEYDGNLIENLIKNYVDSCVNTYNSKVNENKKLVHSLKEEIGLEIRGDSLFYNNLKLNFKQELDKIFSSKNESFSEEIELITDIISNLKYNQSTSEYHLQIIRNLILLYSLIKIRENIENSSNISYLELPTGIGKTNIAIGANLLVMCILKKQKSFYVFPTINIIEQNYNYIKNRLSLDGKNDILSKIYSKSTFSEISIKDIDDETNKYVVNKTLEDYKSFNYPINIISQVNLFETFFSNNKSFSLKLCNLNNSCIVVDELQILPERYWFEIAEISNSYSEIIDIHFIFMSATLPKITELIRSTNQIKIKSIFEDNFKLKEKMFSYFSNRNKYTLESKIERKNYLEYRKYEKELNTYDIDIKKLENSLDELFREHTKGLIVVNTVNLSLELYDTFQNKFKVLLLNSTILPFKKEEIIFNFKNSDKPLLLISTQTIEAGVDLDADFAIREYAPITSISQTGGRVNREFKKEQSPVYIYNFKGDYYKIYKSERKKYDKIKGYSPLFELQNRLSDEQLIEILNKNHFYSESEEEKSYLYNLLLSKRLKNMEGGTNSKYMQYKRQCLFKQLNQIKIIDSFSINLLFEYETKFEDIKEIEDDNQSGKSRLTVNLEIVNLFKELYYYAYKINHEGDKLNTREILELNKKFKNISRDNYTERKIFSKKLSVLNDFFSSRLNLKFYDDKFKLFLKNNFTEMFEDMYFIEKDNEFNKCFTQDTGINRSLFFQYFKQADSCLIL